MQSASATITKVKVIIDRAVERVEVEQTRFGELHIPYTWTWQVTAESTEIQFKFDSRPFHMRSHEVPVGNFVQPYYQLLFFEVSGGPDSSELVIVGAEGEEPPTIIPVYREPPPDDYEPFLFGALVLPDKPGAAVYMVVNDTILAGAVFENGLWTVGTE